MILGRRNEQHYDRTHTRERKYTCAAAAAFVTQGLLSVLSTGYRRRGGWGGYLWLAPPAFTLQWGIRRHPKNSDEEKHFKTNKNEKSRMLGRLPLPSPSCPPWPSSARQNRSHLAKPRILTTGWCRRLRAPRRRCQPSSRAQIAELKQKRHQKMRWSYQAEGRETRGTP